VRSGALELINKIWCKSNAATIGDLFALSFEIIQW